MAKKVRARWWTRAEGYRVILIVDNEVVDQYEATNNRRDSQGPVQENGVGIKTLKKWARETAAEMVAEKREELGL